MAGIVYVDVVDIVSDSAVPNTDGACETNPCACADACPYTCCIHMPITHGVVDMVYRARLGLVVSLPALKQPRNIVK